MRRWMHDLIARLGPHDLRPRPSILRSVSPTAADEPADARLMAWLDPDNEHGFESLPELIDWLQRRAERLRAEKSALQRRLAAEHAFPRFKP